MSTILITGASRGIGLTLAQYLHARGDKVVALNRHDCTEREWDWIECDLSKPDSVSDAVSACSPYRFDGVVLNAALADKTVDQNRPTQMWRHIAVNFLGPHQLWYLLEWEQLIASICNVVLMSSFLQNGNVRQPAYAASKAALWAWMRSYTMAQPASHAVQMNMLWPGRVITPANPLRELPEGDVNAFRTPEEIIPYILQFLDQPDGGPRGTVVDLGRS